MYKNGGSFSVFANSAVIHLKFCSPFTSEESNSEEVYYLPEALWLLPLAFPYTVRAQEVLGVHF